jgi:hypothetical protein
MEPRRQPQNIGDDAEGMAGEVGSRVVKKKKRKRALSDWGFFVIF